MSGKRKVSQAGVEWVVDIVTKRRELERKLSMFPTNAELAQELECSERWIAELIRRKARPKVFVDTSLRVNNPE